MPIKVQGRDLQSGKAAGKILNKKISNETFEYTLSTMKLPLRSGGGGYRFSHQICTDLKNGPDELQNH